MQLRGRRPEHLPLGKRERQRLIASIVTRKRIGTQFELLDALADAGCRVTQATISRDLRELKLEKSHDSVGRPRYVVPDVRRPDPRDALRRVLNLVVVHSELGSAPAIGRALDRLEHPLIVGTLAGDDTCLVIARNNADAATLQGELARALEAR